MINDVKRQGWVDHQLYTGAGGRCGAEQTGPGNKMSVLRGYRVLGHRGNMEDSKHRRSLGMQVQLMLNPNATMGCLGVKRL